MQEYVTVPASSYHYAYHIMDTVMSGLVSEGKLPGDIHFRALSIVDEELRQQVVTQDVLAALDLSEPSGHSYLEDALPDAVLIPVGGTKTMREILRGVEVDYHAHRTLHDIAVSLEVQPHIASQAWLQYVRSCNSELYDRVKTISTTSGERHALNRRSRMNSILGRIVIRDSALLDIYHNPKSIPGNGPVKQEMLHYLLLDNHPGLGPDGPT